MNEDSPILRGILRDNASYRKFLIDTRHEGHNLDITIIRMATIFFIFLGRRSAEFFMNFFFPAKLRLIVLSVDKIRENITEISRIVGFFRVLKRNLKIEAKFLKLKI